MKKLTLAAAIIFTIAFSSCTKENVAPTPKVAKLAVDKGNLSQADFTDPATPPADGDKGNLSQADGDGGGH